MKSKIITNSKRKVAILIVVLLLTCTAIYLLNSIKTNQIIVASKNNERNARKVYTSDFSTCPTEETTIDIWPFYNTSLNIYPSTYTTSTGEETTTYDKDTIRKATLKKYNEKKNDYEVYKGNDNEEYSYMLGDVNGDNKVNEYDAALIWGYKAGEIQFNEIQKRAADVNGDGNIDYNDYLTLLYIDGTYYIYCKTDEETGEKGEKLPSKYLVGNPYFENDLILSNKSTLENSDSYKDIVFNLTDEEIEELRNNPNTTSASDARVVLRLKEFGYYEEGETQEETLLRKMLADYDMNYKIDEGDAQYYLRTAAHLDTSLNTYIEKQLGILRSIEDKTYYDTSIIKINTEKSLMPEVKEDGKYKIEVTNLKTSEISKEVQSMKPQKSNYDMSDTMAGMVGKINYLVDFLKYITQALKDIANQIDAGTLGVTEEYYFDIDTVAPVCDSVTYSETELTNKDVNVTLKFNELVAMTRDDEYSNEKTLTFSDNTDTSLTFYDPAGNSVMTPIRINNIDKSLPILMSWYANKVENQITVTATFNKDISNVENFNLVIKIGGKSVSLDDIEKNISGNQVIFTYDISPADNGKFEITLSGNVIDLAGNDSGNINQIVNNDFETEATAIKNKENKETYYYEFLKNGGGAIKFSQKNYFKKGDYIIVRETKKGTSGDPDVVREYLYELKNKFENNTHIKYMRLNTEKEIAEFDSKHIVVELIEQKKWRS